jgi:hypothetical protein
MFKDIQQRDGITSPKQLLLDMPVRWSSTYVMLDRAEKLQKVRYFRVPLGLSLNSLRPIKHVDEFVYRMAEAESDRSKRKKLYDLKLEMEEWESVKKFLDLLTVCRVASLA